MLGYAHNRQRTVFLREFQRGEKVNAWICAPRSTDNDLALDKNLQCPVTSVIHADLLFLESIKSVIFVFWCGSIVLELISYL